MEPAWEDLRQAEVDRRLTLMIYHVSFDPSNILSIFYFNYAIQSHSFLAKISISHFYRNFSIILISFHFLYFDFILFILTQISWIW